MADLIAPGLWFGLPEDLYHADPALSASGIKNLLVSPLTYWSQSPHLNPGFERRQTAALDFGDFMHARLLEPDRYASDYCRAFDPAAYPNAIAGGDALRARCEELGLKKSGSILELCGRILEADPAAQLLPVLKAKYDEAAAGRTPVPPDIAKKVDLRAKIVQNHTQAMNAFKGGFSEVSLFWTGPDQIRRKCRIDYLKTRAIVDLKTFSNPFRKPLDVAVAHSMANERYHISAVWYSWAVDQIKGLLETNGWDRCIRRFGDADVPGEDWIENFTDARHEFFFVFVESGDVPNVVLRKFTSHNIDHSVTMHWNAATAAIKHALSLFEECQRKFGTNPWRGDESVRAFEEQEFPLWMFD